MKLLITSSLIGAILADRFLWENAALNDNGMLTVSSVWEASHEDMWLTKDKVSDGLPNTYWHSKDGNPSWMDYALDTSQTITKVTIGVRPDCCQDRYNNMCIMLDGENGSNLATKCTTGNYGQPFLNSIHGKSIDVPFSNVKDVKSIRVSFNGGEPGQIQSFIVQGISTPEVSAAAAAPGWNGVSRDETCGMHFESKQSMINSTCTLTGSNIDYVFAGNGAFVVGQNANNYVFTGYDKLSTSPDLIVFFKQDYGLDGRTMDNSTCWDAQLTCTDNFAATGGVFFMENVNDHRHSGKTSYNLLISGVNQGDVLSIQLKSNGGEGWKAQNISAPFGQILTNDGNGVSNDGLVTVEVAERPFGQLFELSVTRQAGEEYNLDLWSSTVNN